MARIYLTLSCADSGIDQCGVMRDVAADGFNCVTWPGRTCAFTPFSMHTCSVHLIGDFFCGLGFIFVRPAKTYHADTSPVAFFPACVSHLSYHCYTHTCNPFHPSVLRKFKPLQGDDLSLSPYLLDPPIQATRGG